MTATIDKLNLLGKSRTQFIFIFDFDLQTPFFFTLNSIPDGILFDIDGFSNFYTNKHIDKDIKFKIFPEAFMLYQQKFNKIIEEIKYGNSYLLNLTSKTRIKTNLLLEDIFYNSQSKFKIMFDNQNFYDKSFVSFSPERFIKIENNTIFTYPMKGTIDSNIKNAKDIILNDQKELAEHTMIVDLLRNDLGIIGTNISVDSFRYIDSVVTNNKSLYQVSSQISANLGQDWQSRIGEILFSLLPAGSITGTPKKKTIEIIKKTENYNREFFSGVCGYFDGNSLDSAVMIRFIEKDKYNNMYYKSGGGITIDSDCKKEYQELIDKIYLPIVT
jgi:para-aminobenzoate synthetase component 1